MCSWKTRTRIRFLKSSGDEAFSFLHAISACNLREEQETLEQRAERSLDVNKSRSLEIQTTQQRQAVLVTCFHLWSLIGWELRLKRWSRHLCQSQSPRPKKFFKRKFFKRLEILIKFLLLWLALLSNLSYCWGSMDLIVCLVSKAMQLQEKRNVPPVLMN